MGATQSWPIGSHGTSLRMSKSRFFAIKMVFEANLLDQADPDDCGSFEIGVDVDPRRELQAILRNGGGLKLGYRLMKEALREHVCIMFVVEKACWDYYTREITSTKSPADNLRRSWELSDNRWAAEPHLFATLRQTLLEFESLEFMRIPMGASIKGNKSVALGLDFDSQESVDHGEAQCPSSMLCKCFAAWG